MKEKLPSGITESLHRKSQRSKHDQTRRTNTSDTAADQRLSKDRPTGGGRRMEAGKLLDCRLVASRRYHRRCTYMLTIECHVAWCFVHVCLMLQRQSCNQDATAAVLQSAMLLNQFCVLYHVVKCIAAGTYLVGPYPCHFVTSLGICGCANR